MPRLSGHGHAPITGEYPPIPASVEHPPNSQCAALAPSASSARLCCEQRVRAKLYVALLSVLRQIEIQPLDDVFAPGAVSASVRKIGIQPFSRKESSREINAARAAFGGETAFFLNLSLGLHKASDVRQDAFQLPAMGLWQVPVQFECLLARLRPALQGKSRRTVTIGTWSGWTDLVLAAYLKRMSPASHHTTFDIRPHVSECIISLLDAYNVTRVRNGWYGGKESWEPLGLGQAYNGSYPAKWPEPVLDFCFIDGGHSYYLAHRDFRTMQTGCRTVAFHDIVNKAVGWKEQPQLWKDLNNRDHSNYAGEFVASATCTQQPSVNGAHMGIGILSRTDVWQGSTA